VARRPFQQAFNPSSDAARHLLPQGEKGQPFSFSINAIAAAGLRTLAPAMK
jgi:predicted dehydrogenase